MKLTTGDFRGRVVEAARDESHGMPVWAFEQNGIKNAVPENWAVAIQDLPDEKKDRWE